MPDWLDLLERITEILWGPWTLYLLLGAGLLFTIWTRFLQFRVLTHGVHVVRGEYDNPDDPGAINHFQALSAALSATIGLGNIGGVALAIGIGGPGALFWMWVVGFLGMALKTVEITLAMLYRNTDDPDDPHGGAMWVIDRTLGARGGGWRVMAKVLGGFFCISLLIMTMAGGNMFQTWNVAELTNTHFGVPQIGTGIVLATVVGLVIVGGIKRIGHVAGRLVPLMCVLYILSAFAVLAVNVTAIPEMLWLIVRSAFTQTEAAGAFIGGTAGLAFMIGMQRALFSNEAGLGSAPIAHAAAKTDQPAREGVVGGLGPFIDTIVICTLTALVIIATGAWDREPEGEVAGEVDLRLVDRRTGETELIAPTSVADLPDLPEGERYHAGEGVFFLIEAPDDPEDPDRWRRQRLAGRIEPGEAGEPNRIAWSEPPPRARWVPDEAGEPQKGVYRQFTGASLTSHAFDRAFPGLGKWLVTLAAWLFAISTMITWAYYGEQGTLYLTGKRGVLPYKLVFLALAIFGAVAVQTDRQLGALTDFGTGWMLWANMIIVLMLGFLAVGSLREYFGRLDAGEFHPHAARRFTDLTRSAEDRYRD